MSIYGARYHTLGQTLYYTFPETCRPGDQVLVEGPSGLALARIVAGPLEALPGTTETELPRVLRMANEEDIEIGRKNSELSEQAAIFCKHCIKDRKLDMKLVDVEIFFDRSKFIFYFTSPTRIDFRELVKDLVREYRARIELRQIGVRHETQMVGGIGNCGRICCCRQHLRKFAPVTIKMAKEQNLFLNPAKISGMCGRLLCCLSYEQDNYEQFHREAPRCGKKYLTDRGLLKVQRVNMFANTVSVLNAKNEEIDFSLEEWRGLHPRRPPHEGKGWDEPETENGPDNIEENDLS